MAKQSIPVQTRSIAATGAINAHRFVTFAGAQAGAGANTLGVARTDATTGQIVAVDVLGSTVVEAGAQIAAGAAVEVGANGKAITRDTGAIVGRAVEAAAGDGAFIEIILIPN